MATSSTQSSADDAFMADLLKDVDQAAPPPSQASQPTRPSSSFATAFRSKAPAAPAASPPPANPPSLSQISQSLFAKPKPPSRPSTQPAKPPPTQRQNAPPSQPAVAGPSTQRTAFSRGSGSASQKPLARSQSAQSPLRAIKRESVATPALSDVSFADDDDWLADLDEKHLLATTAKTEPMDVPMPPPAPAASTSSLVKQASRTQSKLWAQRANEEKSKHRIHRSYIRCRVLSVRETTYDCQLPNSDRVSRRPQKILLCMERPRRGAQYHEDKAIEGELPLATWDGRSEAGKRKVVLREEWTATRVKAGDYIHCVGNWEDEVMDFDEEAEVRRVDELEHYNREVRDAKCQGREPKLERFKSLSPVKKEEVREISLPPASFESTGSLFADLDEEALIADDTPRPTIATMYLESSSPLSTSKHADNLLVLHPDTLVTATAVCDVPTCVRKPLVKQRIHGTGAVDHMGEAIVMGNMLHEVLQACLTGMGLEPDEHTAPHVPEFDSQELLAPYLDMPFPVTWYGPGRTNFSLAFVLKQVRLQVLSNLAGLLCCNIETMAGVEKLLDLCRPFGEFARRYLEDTLAANRADLTGAQFQGLFRGMDGALDMAGMFKDDATLVDARSTVPTLARVTHVFDVEEEIWSPMYGLKGKMDVSVEVEIQETHTDRPSYLGGNQYDPQQQQQARAAPTSFYRRTQSAPQPPAQHKERSVSIMPMEIKTGRSVDVLEHRAQTMLYTLIMSDRYGTDVKSGLLYYSRSGDMHRVRRTRNEVRGLIVGRNELAYWIRHNAASEDVDEDGNWIKPDEQKAIALGQAHENPDRQTVLPPTIDNERQCGRCFAAQGCMLYRKAVDQVVEDPDAPSDIAVQYDQLTSHLSPAHVAFYAKWERLLSLEEEDMVKFKRELWTLTAAAREEVGRCFANMLIEPTPLDSGHTGSAGDMHAYTYRFTRKPTPGSPGQSLLGGSLTPGDPIVISIEPHTFSVAHGYIVDITPTSVLTGLDHHLDAIIERIAIEQGQPPTIDKLDLTFRIDRDEYSDGMAKIRFQLSRLFWSTTPRDERHRELIVDLAPPRYGNTEFGEVIEDDKLPAHLNEDQRNAMRKVLASEDYTLILGMPGTGKTTTIAELIKLLTSKGKTILLASYTHSAVDTILRKLVNVEGVRLLRLGNVDRVHADIQSCTLPPTTTVEELDDILNTPNVIGTTCLSTGHATFARRKFDYCIVDEASQITLPSCLGPMRFADKFVLVGDHFQLPPLVRNPIAKDEGLDVSLFKRLSDAHGDSTVYLTRQYRMNESIMKISNHLIYEGLLKCGNEAVAKQVLEVPMKAAALAEVHQALPSSCKGIDGSTTCWLETLLDERRQAVFVDTDAVPGHESRRGRMVQNDVEAGVLQQLARTLVLSGVAPSDIAVITPYRQQLKLLQRLLLTPKSSQEMRDNARKRRTAAQIKREANTLSGTTKGPGGDIEVLTADRSQGRDKPVVLLSLVRSNDLGQRGIGELLNDWRRINVALTRAQRKVVIVGSRETLSAAPLLQDFFALMDEEKWVCKLPRGALQMHPAAAVEPGAPRGVVVAATATQQQSGAVAKPFAPPHGSQERKKAAPSSSSRHQSPTVAAEGFVSANPRRRSSGTAGAAADSSAPLEEIQPLSQTSSSSANGKAKRTNDDDDYDIDDIEDFAIVAGPSKWQNAQRQQKASTFTPASSSSTALGKRKERPIDAQSMTKPSTTTATTKGKAAAPSGSQSASPSPPQPTASAASTTATKPPTASGSKTTFGTRFGPRKSAS